jgi:hypothetical protein
MAFDIHTSHRTILLLPLVVYVVLVYFVAIAPSLKVNRDYPSSDVASSDVAEGAAAGSEAAPGGALPSGVRPLSPLAKRGEEVYVSYGCTVCHTQQIRGDERLRVQIGDSMVVPVRAPDARYGLDEPTRPEEYANATPPFLGTQRTGPDLTGVGDRLPSVLWHYWHLYDPRSVSPGSVMPPYRFLFRVTTDPDGKLPPDQPFNAGLAWLWVAILALVFVGLGWLLFGFTPTLLITLALGVGAGWMMIRDCEVCAVPIGEGEVVEEGIDALGLPKDAKLVASPEARALAEYLLSLKRPVVRR